MDSDALVKLYDLIDNAKPDDVKDALKESVVLLAGLYDIAPRVITIHVDQIEAILKGGK